MLALLQHSWQLLPLLAIRAHRKSSRLGGRGVGPHLTFSGSLKLNSGSSIPRPAPLNQHNDEDNSSEDLSDFDDDDVEDEDDDDDEEEEEDDDDDEEPELEDFHSAAPAPAPEPEPVVEEEIDPLVAAEQAKEEGNAKFRQGHYGAAIDLYTKAHRECDALIFIVVCSSRFSQIL